MARLSARPSPAWHRRALWSLSFCLPLACTGRPLVLRAPATSPVVSHYSARLRISFSGPQGRARGDALIAFARPDRLRIEIPGPTGARLVALAAGGQLTAVLPRERAVHRGPATTDELGRLLAVALGPSEIMDLLSGQPPPSVELSRLKWRDGLPEDIGGRLHDGTSLRIRVRELSLGELPERAFEEPRCPGCRLVDALEARELVTR
jgi:hypothetical protein